MPYKEILSSTALAQLKLHDNIRPIDDAKRQFHTVVEDSNVIWCREKAKDLGMVGLATFPVKNLSGQTVLVFRPFDPKEKVEPGAHPISGRITQRADPDSGVMYNQKKELMLQMML
jgi:hypothetical protein